MIAWMNAEALRADARDGRGLLLVALAQALWKKGESSGNVLALVDLKADCDADTLLVRALPAGPTCHTGSQTCFGTDGNEPAPTELAALDQTILARKNAPAGTKSYTRRCSRKIARPKDWRGGRTSWPPSCPADRRSAWSPRRPICSSTRWSGWRRAT